MSVKALSWALDAIIGDKTAKLVLVSLADFCDENGECWPSQKRLAQRAECSVRSVQRALQKLVDDEFISIGRRHRDSGYRDVNLYVVNFARLGVRMSLRPKRQPDVVTGTVKGKNATRVSNRGSEGVDVEVGGYAGEHAGRQAQTQAYTHPLAADDEVPT